MNLFSSLIRKEFHPAEFDESLTPTQIFLALPMNLEPCEKWINQCMHCEGYTTVRDRVLVDPQVHIVYGLDNE